MQPERSDLRAAIVAAFRRGGLRREPPEQYKGLMNIVAKSLTDQGFTSGVEYNETYGSGRLKELTERRFREEVWDLIAAGVLVPGRDQSNDQWPWLSLTEPGRELVEQQDPSPADPAGFVAAVDEIIPGEDQRVLLYLREAVGAFNRRLYVATTVMLGVAAEGLILRLAEAIKGAYGDSNEGADWYEGEIETMWALAQYRAVRDQVEDVAGDLPHDLAQRFEAHWHSIHTLVRMERNKSGHPTGRDLTRDEAHASLILFPTLARLVGDFEDWAQEHRGVF